MTDRALEDVWVVACADTFRGDGEVLVSPIGPVPLLGGRLAQATFEPDLLLTDGQGRLLAGDVVEGWMPYRFTFDMLWSGRRHVMMGATQIDRTGNQNIACIGDWHKPKAQLLGVRGAPGNTVNHPTSYWVPNHSPRVFVERVDFVSGIGYPSPTPFHEIRRVVSNLGVFDFETPERAMRLRSVHPGVSVDDVIAATGFELVVPHDVPESRTPTTEEREMLERLRA